MLDEKYLPHHVVIYDSALRNLVEEALKTDLTQRQSVTHLVRLDEARWLARLEYDVTKDLDLQASSPKTTE